MRARLVFVLCGLSALPMSGIADAAPAQLYGKSVVVSVSETRASRPVTGGPVTSSSASSQFSVYISEAGRPFVPSDPTLTTGPRDTEHKPLDTPPRPTTA